MTMITPSYLGDTIEYSSYASNALGALPYGRPAGGREFTSDWCLHGRCLMKCFNEVLVRIPPIVQTFGNKVS